VRATGGYANGDKLLSASARSHQWLRCLCPHDSLTVSPRSRGDHRVAEGRAVSPRASPPRRGSVRLWRSGFA
jgi:hypothetical protein